MEQSVFEPLSEITLSLKEGKVHSKQARTYLTKCIDHLMNLTVNTDSEIQDILHKYIPIFLSLIHI